MTEQTYVATGFPVAGWMGCHDRVLPCRDRKGAEQGILCREKVSISRQRIVIGTGFSVARNPSCHDSVWPLQSLKCKAT